MGSMPVAVGGCETGPSRVGSIPIAGSDFHAADRPGRWIGSITTPGDDLERLRGAGLPISPATTPRSRRAGRPIGEALNQASDTYSKMNQIQTRKNSRLRDRKAIMEILDRFRKGLSKNSPALQYSFMVWAQGRPIVPR